MKTPIELTVSDACRVIDARLRYILWERQSKGEKIFSSNENPLERMSYYEKRFVKYANYLRKHITNGTPLQDVFDFFETVIGFVPEALKDEVLEYIFKYLKELVASK